MKRLAILGASGHGKVVADTAECCGWQQIDFFDDAWPDMTINGCWSVIGATTELLARLDDYNAIVVAIGNNRIRQLKLDELRAVGANLVTLVHPSAVVSRHAQIAEGTVVFSGAQINAGASVGVGAIINTGCSVDHDCLLADAVHISPGAHLAGGVKVGSCSWVGIGASVRQLVTLGENVIVGAGAAVVGDVPDGFVVAGVPAKRIK
ncbi:acetyltransferase [Pseudomonas sp. MM211]|uniref:acetyltransferase n=1 Tax=Pseudomonas sp. MM211 TaxID=2866808 RepID=UPI001CED4466|nr:acetyltransferase [Pseudomonas sp. MM211]UCJ15198.1 acetyltransferase [Pseudomonas sp. MM211]